MPRVGFELTIPAFERIKTVHALDRAATVIGGKQTTWRYIPEDSSFHNYLINQSETQSLS
jgi:hypothetical protein